MGSKKRSFILIFVLAQLFLLLPNRSGAAEYSEIRCDRAVKQVVENGETRCYKMDVSVWRENAIPFLEEAPHIILLLEMSPEMMFLADAPTANESYQAGKAYSNKISSSQVLYTQKGGNYVPVVLRSGEWKLLSRSEAGQNIFGESVGNRKNGEDIFTQVMYEKGGCLTRLEVLQKSISEFLEKIKESNPHSKAGLVFYGGKVSTVQPVQLSMVGLASLQESLYGSGELISAGCSYSSALKEAAGMAEQLYQQQTASCTLITVAASTPDEEERSATSFSAQQLQKIGAKNKIILVDLEPEEKEEEFWQFLSSAPLSEYYQTCSPTGLFMVMEESRRQIVQSLSVSVTQVLDSRFCLSPSEKSRIGEEASLFGERENGVTVITWEVELPVNQSEPWKASIEFNAKPDFPGGNCIPVDNGESGVFFSGNQIASFSEAYVNVPIKFSLGQLHDTLFLGEHVKGTLHEKDVEEAMFCGNPPNWYGKGETGTLSYFWEREDGSPIGTMEQLTAMYPCKGEKYCFRVSYIPYNTGTGAVGKAVEQVQVTGGYTVQVVSGSIHLIAAVPEQAEENGLPVFSLKKGESVFYSTAWKNGDTGKAETDFSGIPFGVYQLRQINSAYDSCEQEILLGVCRENDTLSLKKTKFEIKMNLSPKKRQDDFSYCIRAMEEKVKIRIS